MGDPRPSFLAKVAQAAVEQARELELPDVQTVPGTRLDFASTGGIPAPVDHRLTKLEERQREIARVIEGIGNEARSTRAELGRVREVMIQANALNKQVTEALAALAEKTDLEDGKVQRLAQWKARVAGIAVGAGAVTTVLGWFLEHVLLK